MLRTRQSPLRLAFAALIALTVPGRMAVAAAAELLPAGVTLPLVVWDITFNDNPLDAPPQPLTKVQIEAQAKLSEWQRLPIRHCSVLQYIMETRRALVVKEAGGLKDKPLLFTYTDQAQPHYGPMASFAVPPEIAKHGAERPGRE